MSRRAMAVCAAVLGIAVALPASGGDVCQYVGVLDACRAELQILNVGGSSIVHRVSLFREDLAGTDPYGFTFASVPEYGDFFSFVAHGPLLRIVDIRESEPVRTIDLRSVYGLSGASLTRVHAAPPVSLDSNPKYLLYAIGILNGKPWLWIFDQRALLGKPVGWRSAILASGMLSTQDEGSEVSGFGIDVAAGGTPEEGGVQEAHASAFHWTTDGNVLRVYRIVVREDPSGDLGFSVVLDPRNREAVPFSGSNPFANGLDYDEGGTMPFGVFQTTSVVKKLEDEELACTVPGDPADVSVWGSGDGPKYLFVTAPNPDGTDLLLGYPAGQCPDGGPPSLELPMTGHPRALALSSDTSDSPWIYTANREGRIGAVHVALGPDLSGIEVLSSLEILTETESSCPWEVDIRVDSFINCVGDPKPIDLDCDGEDAGDPRCNRPSNFGP